VKAMSVKKYVILWWRNFDAL